MIFKWLTPNANAPPLAVAAAPNDVAAWEGCSEIQRKVHGRALEACKKLHRVM